MENFEKYYIDPSVEQQEKVNLEGVSAIITNDLGQILLMNHTKFGGWTVPVGKPEVGESLEDAIKREMFEELDIIINDKATVGRVLYRSRYDEGSPLQANTVFRVTDFTGTIKNKEGIEKCLDIQFVDPIEFWKMVQAGEKTTTATIKALEVLISEREL